MAMTYMFVKTCMQAILLPNVLNNCLRDTRNSHLRKKSREVSAKAGRGCTHTHFHFVVKILGSVKFADFGVLVEHKIGMNTFSDSRIPCQ